MNSLNWHLDSLQPHQGNAFKTLDEWFNPDLNQFMDYYYREGIRHHPKNINKFTRADYRENIKRGHQIWWRRQMARRLFGLRMAVSEQTTHIDRYVKAYYDPHHSLYNHFWLMRNCQPYCGVWSADNRGLYKAGNPTGYPCLSRLCPWCWMRRFDLYVRACKCPTGYTVKSRRFSIPGLNFPELINVTSFDYVQTTQDPDDPFFNEPFEFYTQRAFKAFKQVRMGPNDPILFRLTTPLYREHTERAVSTPQVGVRVGFLHTDPVFPGIEARLPGMVVCRDVTVEDAIRWTYPYPIGWLESSNFVKIKLRLLGCFHRLSHHGTTTLIKATPTRNQTCHTSTPTCTRSPG